MAFNPHSLSLLRFRASFLSLNNSPISHPLLLPKRPLEFSPRPPSHHSITIGATSSRRRTVSASGFTWDDVFKIANSPHDSPDLRGFFDRVTFCNRGSGLLQDKQHEFMPFFVNDQIVGYVHEDFAGHLQKFCDVFVFHQNNSHSHHAGNHVMLHPMLMTPDQRTTALADVVRCLGEELIPGIRNELYPVTSSFGTPVFFSLERAAAPYFGIKAYGVHMNGYVERAGQKYLWIGKRSEGKQTYPGMLDHLVAGGLPHGIACGDNIVKECEEEAGIPSSISNEAIPVGAVSYMDIDGYRYKRDVLFCYDLKLPEGFIPENQDGEVESFKLIPVADVANVIRKTGFIRPEEFGYLKLLQSLRSGDCS
ncbi:nudix hydrolase 20, chloroplastic-like isoform X3 [Rhododendron vialii]|uniref:nudix hydrolase 20, chloroplastic-like isoform X3 n=1 Tax=Rhododendron vialii TaxID=182163 RepID=UPI00265FD2DE|nr:nudix hydrolase 20, chloroplastic-like isoform X3 [Rhododendron vialii]